MTSVTKTCKIYIEQVRPERMGISQGIWVVWCQELGDDSQEHTATVYEGAGNAARAFQALVDTQKARGYRVLFESEEM